MKSLAKWSWILLFLVGMSFAIYAYYNLVTIPALEPDDPERGWAWLTTDPEVIEYIKFTFRMLGYWVLALAVLVMAISATGYRKGERWAWYCLLYLPIHIVIFMLIIPWTIPVLIILLAAVLIGLVLPVKTFFDSK
jgi:hypothetical protein